MDARTGQFTWDHHGPANRTRNRSQHEAGQGAPPKVIWLAVGNAGTKTILQLLLERAAIVKEFHSAKEESLLVLELHSMRA